MQKQAKFELFMAARLFCKKEAFIRTLDAATKLAAMLLIADGSKPVAGAGKQPSVYTNTGSSNQASSDAGDCRLKQASSFYINS